MARRSKANAIDWDAIERQYRIGQKSNKQLGEEFGVSDSSIGKRAKRLGWVVDKSEEVEAVTKSLLIQSASGNSNPNSTPSALEIKAAGQANADLIQEHRRGLARLKRIRDQLLDHIEAAAANLPDLLEAVDMIRQEDERGIDRANDALRKSVDRPALVDDFKKLVDVDEKIRKGDREAYGIGGNEDASAFEYEAVLRKARTLSA